MLNQRCPHAKKDSQQRLKPHQRCPFPFSLSPLLPPPNGSSQWSSLGSVLPFERRNKFAGDFLPVATTWLEPKPEPVQQWKQGGRQCRGRGRSRSRRRGRGSGRRQGRRLSSETDASSWQLLWHLRAALCYAWFTLTRHERMDTVTAYRTKEKWGEGEKRGRGRERERG